MPFVIDASVVGSWILPDEKHPDALTVLDRLNNDTCTAPGLLWYEIRNLLLINERRQRITAMQTATAVHLLQSLPIQLDRVRDSSATFQLARDHQLTIYDAAYLELAVRHGIPLITFNNKLASASNSLGLNR